MTKKKAFFGLTICLFFIFSMAFVETHSTAQVAWGVHELTSSEAAAGVTGTGVAIGASQAIATAIKGASWGARIGAYAGPIGLVGGALIGGL